MSGVMLLSKMTLFAFSFLFLLPAGFAQERASTTGNIRCNVTRNSFSKNESGTYQVTWDWKESPLCLIGKLAGAVDLFRDSPHQPALIKIGASIEEPIYFVQSTVMLTYGNCHLAVWTERDAHSAKTLTSMMFYWKNRKNKKVYSVDHSTYFSRDQQVLFDAHYNPTFLQDHLTKETLIPAAPEDFVKHINGESEDGGCFSGWPYTD